MVIGVSFRIPQTTTNSLWQIFKCIDIERYYWYNIESQNEVWTSPQGELFFETDFYDGQSFLKQICSDHYLVFLKLQAYLATGEFYDIHTYEEFQKSDCQVLFLVYDCEFVEIFSKDFNNLKIIYENAVINNFFNVEYITESNNGRTKMDVL